MRAAFLSVAAVAGLALSAGIADARPPAYRGGHNHNHHYHGGNYGYRGGYSGGYNNFYRPAYTPSYYGGYGSGFSLNLGRFGLSIGNGYTTPYYGGGYYSQPYYYGGRGWRGW